MIDICKLAAALVFAAIAGLTAIAAGLLSEVRISVLIMRTACIFLATGVLVYIGAFLFEKIGYESLIKDTEKAMDELKQKEQENKEQDQQSQEAEAGTEKDAANEDEEASPQQEDGKGEQPGFAPLDADSLRKVTGSSETQ